MEDVGLRRYQLPEATLHRFRGDFPKLLRSVPDQLRRYRGSSATRPNSARPPAPVPWPAIRRIEGRRKSAEPKISGADELRQSARTDTRKPTFLRFRARDYSADNTNFPRRRLRVVADLLRSHFLFVALSQHAPPTFANASLDQQVCRRIPRLRFLPRNRRGPPILQRRPGNQAVV